MPMNAAARRDPSARGWVGLSILIAALLLVAAMVLSVSGLAGTAQGQAGSGAIPSVALVSNEPGQLVITWQAPDPAPTDYRIIWTHTSLDYLSYKDSNEAERGNVYPVGGVTTLTLNDLTPGENYKVQIRARYYNADRSVHERSGPWTAVATQRVKNHPPAEPTGLTAAQVGHSVLTLTWDDPQDANITGYRVLRGPDAGSLSTIETDTGSASTEYTDATVAAETTYFYAVLALSADGDGPQSSAISATTPAAPPPADPPPAEPTGLTAARVGHSVLTLTWDDPQDARITGYRVMRGPDAGSLSTIETDTGSASTEYTDATVAAETTYFYAVLALSADGNGAQSSAISATTPAAPPPADPPPAEPTGLTAARVGHDSLTLTWEDSQDARITWYRVMRGPDAGSLSTIETDTGSASTEYTDTTVAAETTYFYAVLALSADGYGAQSSAISVTTPAAPATPPPAISMVVPSDALTDRMTQLEVNLTNLPAGRYNVRVTVTTDAADSAAEVAAHDAVLVVSDPPQSSQQQATESDTVLPINQWGYVSVSPGTPTVTQEGAEVLISWTPGVGNVRNYQVERRATPCPRICISMIHTDGAGTSYRDVGVNSERTYLYRVRAMYANGRSIFSAGASITTAAVVEGVPKPPRGLTVRYDAYTAAIVLSWTAPDPASDVRNYRLLRCRWTSLQDLSCGQFLTGSTDTAYSDTNVEPGHSYSYSSLRAVGDGGDSYPTGWVIISVPAAGTLTAPTGLTAVHDETAGTVALSWTAPDPSTGLVNYRVLRCEDWRVYVDYCTGILTGSTATTYTDTAVSGTRSYGVKAVNAVGDSYSSTRVYLRIE